MKKEYSIRDKNNKEINFSLSDKLSAIVNGAEADYEKSKSYIFSREFNIWREAYKLYHLSAKDRKELALKDQQWRSNATSGMTRAFVDIMVSSLQDKPLNFQIKGINKKGFENASKIKKVLDYISDVSLFHTQIKRAYKNGLITGNIAFRVGYKEVRKNEKYYNFIGNEIIEEIIENEELSIPYAQEVSIFNLFPDPYTGPLRYITERQVISYENFIKAYGKTLRDKDNESNLGQDKFLEVLLLNSNLADKQDYGDIVDQIHQDKNSEYKEYDTFNSPKTNNSFSVNQNIGDDSELTNGLIEVKTTWYKTRLVIIANGYPVYIGKNPYGFIPYVYKPSDNSELRFGEGIPYVVGDVDKIKTSTINNTVDSVRAVSNPTIVAQKNLLINEYELEDGTPGGVLWTEDNRNGNVAYALNKGNVTDFGLNNIMQEIGTFKTGVSEYNMGIAARERTASGALAVSQSSEKRLSPYVSAFLDSISIISSMWLSLIKKYWTSNNSIYVLDEDGKQFWEDIKNKDLIGGVNISLEAEGMVGVNQVLRANKLTELYQTLGPSGFVNANEIAKELIRNNGFNTDRFITQPGEGVKPDNANDIAAEANQTGIPGVNALSSDAKTLGDNLGQSLTPNGDLGNGGKGQ